MSIISLFTEKSGKEFAKQVIESYMKKQKMDTIEEFLKQNPTMQDFDTNTKLLNIIRKHGYFVMNEQEYQDIIEQIRQEEEEKRKLHTEDIQTINVNGKELVTYTDEETGKQITVDNSVSERSVENQMKDIQNDHKQFQSLKDNNTLNIMNYMEAKIKITPDTKNSAEIKQDNLNNEERKIATAAKDFENQIGHPVDIDLNSKMIYDNGMIYSIEKRGEEYQVIAQGKGMSNSNEQTNTKSKQLVRTNTLPKAS